MIIFSKKKTHGFVGEPTILGTPLLMERILHQSIRLSWKLSMSFNFIKRQQLATLKISQIRCMDYGQIVVIIQHHLDHTARISGT